MHASAGTLEASGSQELELQEIVSLIWMLGIELQTSARAVSAFNRWAISPAPLSLILFTVIFPHGISESGPDTGPSQYIGERAGAAQASGSGAVSPPGDVASEELLAAHGMRERVSSIQALHSERERGRVSLKPVPLPAPVLPPPSPALLAVTVGALG